MVTMDQVECTANTDSWNVRTPRPAMRHGRRPAADWLELNFIIYPSCTRAAWNYNALQDVKSGETREDVRDIGQRYENGSTIFTRRTSHSPSGRRCSRTTRSSPQRSSID